MATNLFPTVIIADRGVVYYLGESSPTVFQESIVKEWKKLPVVTLFYDGPEEFEGIVETALSDVGVLTGVGTPLFVFLREKNGYIAIRMRFGGEVFDDFEDPIPKTELKRWIGETVREIFGEVEKPPFGFLVVDRDGILETRVGRTQKPVEYVKSVGEYTVEIDGKTEKLKEGFQLIEGRLIYVGKNLKVSKKTAEFLEGVELIYPDGSVYRDGKLIKPDGMVFEFDKPPVGVWEEWIVSRNTVYRGAERVRELKNTAVGVFGNLLLMSDGSIEEISGSWKMDVSCPPVEWAFREDGIYVLDVCGNLIRFNLEVRKTHRIGRFPGAYGFDFLGDDVVVGTPDGVILNGRVVGEGDFCVENGRIITGRGFVRTHIGLCLRKIEDGYSVRGIVGSRYRLFPEFIVLKGEHGIWVVKSPGKGSTSSW